MVKDWGNRLICRIDVTGFLSIQVALLVMFMVQVPDANNLRVTVDLSKVRHTIPMPGADREDALIVTVMRDGKIYFGTELLRSADGLSTKLQDRVRDGSQKRVYIKADAHVKYSAVNEVLHQIHLAGIEKVSFLTETLR